MTLLPSHAHLKRYYVNLKRGDFIVVTVTDIIQPKEDNGYPRYRYKVQVDPDKKVVWPEEETDDDYYAE